MAITSMWSSLATWFTPTVLFCVLNLLIIAIIFLASSFKSPNHYNSPNSPSQLTRSPSLLQRVKSLNLSSFYTTTIPDDQTTEYNSASRAPSILQRVRSIDYSFSSFYTSNHVASSTTTAEPEQLGNSTGGLTRASSLLDRVKSFKLTSSSFYSNNHNSGSGDTNIMQDEPSNMDTHLDSLEGHDVTSNKLANLFDNPNIAIRKRSPKNLSKSSSEKRVMTLEDDEDVDRRRPSTMRAPRGIGDESVDAKADDFIKRFKQQLKLQRIDSLHRFREMLNRGT